MVIDSYVSCRSKLQSQTIKFTYNFAIYIVTAKYKPPILPIGKGAYVIVWFLCLCLSFFCLISSISFFCFFESENFWFSSALNLKTNEHLALKKIENVFDNQNNAKRTLRKIKLFIVVDSDFLNYWRLEFLFGCIVQLVLHIIFELLAS